jgi:hypothetical protein
MNSKLSLLVLIVFFLLACSEKRTKITLTNKEDLALVDKPIRIARGEIDRLPKGKMFPLVLNESDTIPAQLDDLNGDGEWDELFFVVNMPPQGKLNLTLSWQEDSIAFPPRTSVRFGKRDGRDLPVRPLTSDTLLASEIHARLGYQPYQTDGPSWENDRVGFRHYFDGRNSKDLFGKKVSYMSPENVGISATGAVEDNYHVMADWGRDVLAVGNSVGIGGINLMIGDSLSRIGTAAGDTVTNVEMATFNIVQEGPVRSIMDFNYFNWRPLDRTYQVHERVSIWPGMYAFQNSVNVSGLQGDETLLVGLVNSNTRNPLKEILVNDRFVALLTHDQQTYDREWWLGLALILPRDIYEGNGEAPKEGIFSNTFYGKLKITEQTPVTYYAVGCWELSDEGFRDPEYFEDYVINLAQQLSAEVDVEIE